MRIWAGSIMMFREPAQLHFYSQIDHASRFKIDGGRQDPRIQIGLQPRARDL